VVVYSLLIEINKLIHPFLQLLVFLRLLLCTHYTPKPVYMWRLLDNKPYSDNGLSQLTQKPNNCIVREGSLFWDLSAENNIGRKKLIQHPEAAENEIDLSRKNTCEITCQKSGLDLGLRAWRVAQSQQRWLWVAGYCWVCVGVEEGWAFSQDVASLPSLRGSQKESRVPFNFSFFSLYLRRVC